MDRTKEERKGVRVEGVPPVCHRLERSFENTSLRYIHTLPQIHKLLAGRKAGQGEEMQMQRGKDILYFLLAIRVWGFFLASEHTSSFIDNPTYFNCKQDHF